MVLVYNYLIDSLPIHKDTKYPISKKNELKKVYNEIVNLSKNAPFYKINLTKENQEYTIGIKEAALALKSKIIDLTDSDLSGFQNKRVKVSDDKILYANLTKDSLEGLPEAIKIEVKSLAKVQINRGKEILLTSHGLPSKEYRFSATIGEEEYLLNYNHATRMENKESLEQIADFLNQSIPGIHAIVERGNTKEYGRLAIASDMSGRFGDLKFEFEDLDDNRFGVVDYFGMNRVDQEATYAHFILNGIDKRTATNTFTLENRLKITLQKEGVANLKIVSDHEKILSSVNSIMITYNEMIKLVKERYLEGKEYKVNRLMEEMRSLEDVYKEELSACGWIVLEDGSLELEESLGILAAEDGGMESLFTRENGFIARLLKKAETIAINPMEYLDKTIVTYPNHEKSNYPNPYVTSIYSGMLFNSYC